MCCNCSITGCCFCWDLRARKSIISAGVRRCRPLTREEEEFLLQRLSSGDAAVRAMLIERNLRLVVYIARKFENTGINIEDLVSIGAIGLIKAVNTFDPEKKSNSPLTLHAASRTKS